MSGLITVANSLLSGAVGGTAGAVIVERVRHNNVEKSSRNDSRRERIKSWITFLDRVERQYDESWGFRENANYLSLRENLDEFTIKQVSRVQFPDDYREEINDILYAEERQNFYETITELKNQVVKLEKKWKLI